MSLPKKYFDLYPLDEIILEQARRLGGCSSHCPGTRFGQLAVLFPITIDQARKCNRHWAESFVDAQVGRLWKNGENDILDKTIIVFIGPRIFSWRKGIGTKAFERSRPRASYYLCSGHGKRGSGRTSRWNCSICIRWTSGISGPIVCRVSPFVPCLIILTRRIRQSPLSLLCGTAEMPGVSLRTERYRYIEWLEGRAGKELYDHTNDSEEETNLAGYPEHEKLIASLSDNLNPMLL